MFLIENRGVNTGENDSSLSCLMKHNPVLHPNVVLDSPRNVQLNSIFWRRQYLECIFKFMN